jgi:hypothetical protein
LRAVLAAAIFTILAQILAGVFWKIVPVAGTAQQTHAPSVRIALSVGLHVFYALILVLRIPIRVGVAIKAQKIAKAIQRQAIQRRSMKSFIAEIPRLLCGILKQLQSRLTTVSI